MTTLENDVLRVSIRPKGAELASIFDKKNSLEHLWQADPAVWGWHAPNLFPVVGACLNDQIVVENQPYPMQRHGFARHSEFTLKESSSESAVFSLLFSEKTLAVFPYRFELQVAYALDGASLRVIYRVLNQDEKPIFFSFGAHPAFNVPFFPGEAYSDYFLEFEREEELTTHLLDPSGLFSGAAEPVPTEGHRLHLTEHLFDRDALVFKNHASRRVSLGSTRHERRVAVAFPDFDYLGLWAKPGGSFVCIEPWLGCADTEHNPLPFEQREGIQRVEVGGRFEVGFTLTIS
ncbi:MAG: aldose 1-epimerase family protein [Sphingobacteriaceae bacterium]|nr:aldose 1-epimerase family protein [Cytophagaceae bacterium]